MQTEKGQTLKWRWALVASAIGCIVMIWFGFDWPHDSEQGPSAGGNQIGSGRDQQARARFELDSQPGKREELPVPSPQLEMGSIVVLDSDNNEHSRESGYMMARVRSAEQSTVDPTMIAVRDGMWNPQELPDGEFVVQRISLRGKEAIPMTNQSLLLIGKQVSSLRCRWLAAAVLHVVDATSSKELDAVTLYWMDNLSNDRIEFPIEVGGAHVIGEGLTSPIEMHPLPPTTGPVTLFAYRHNYAWGRLAFDRTGGGQQYIRLQRGGNLTAKLVGDAPTSDMTVRLWRGLHVDRNLLAERSLRRPGQSRPVVEFVGLSPGRYHVTLEKGARDQAPVLAEKSALIQGGADVTVDLELPLIPPDQETEVLLAVSIDPSWDLSTFTILLTDLDLPLQDSRRTKRVRSDRMTRVDAVTYVSEPTKVRCGRHELYLNEARYGIECSVWPSREPQQLTLNLPPRGFVGLTIVSAQTGELVLQPNVCWASLKSSGEPSGTGCVGVRGTTPGRIEFQAPQGKVQLNTSGGPLDMYLGDNRIVEIVPGMQEFVIQLPPARCASFELREGERQVEWTSAVLGSIVFKSSRGSVMPKRTAIDSRSGLLSCFLADADSYSVSFPEIPGYMPIDPIEVDLTTRPNVQAVVHLVRQQ
ncbi:MAG: hypothetical protein IPK67_16010 [Planctomycetes bacterium]|nr:hypothetical protein [Planctomycetota bacterium]